VNDVNNSKNYVKVLILKDCTFVSELVYVTNKIYGIAICPAFIKYEISNS